MCTDSEQWRRSAPVGARVFGDVVERLLGDAVEGYLDLRGHITVPWLVTDGYPALPVMDSPVAVAGHRVGPHQGRRAAARAGGCASRPVPRASTGAALQAAMPLVGVARPQARQHLGDETGGERVWVTASWRSRARRKRSRRRPPARRARRAGRSHATPNLLTDGGKAA